VSIDEGKLSLSQKERDRLKVLHEAMKGHILQREAAMQLGMSERWIRERIRRLRASGDRSLIHGLRGKASKRALKSEEREQLLSLYREHYADFGPTLAAEYLTERHGLTLSRETVRKELVKAGLWKAKPRRVKKVHVWRPRRSMRGELLQWDTSTHDWLEGRGEKLYLISLIDDATSELFARFACSESTRSNLEVLRQYLERNGRPAAVYTDKAGHFQVNPGQINHYGDRSREGTTQIERALGELGILRIAAHSPQAKGRVERCFGTLQDRLVKSLRLAGVKTLEEANRHLEEEFLPLWKKRFTRKPASAVDAHRPVEKSHDLDSILSHVETRHVANDYTVSWQSKRWQIPRQAIEVGLRKRKVRVEARADGSVWVRLNKGLVEAKLCNELPAANGAEQSLPQEAEAGKPNRARKDHNRGGKSDWMRNFGVKNYTKIAIQGVVESAARGPRPGKGRVL
jgi:transposase